MGGELIVRIQDGHATGQIGNVDIAFVLVEAARVADLARERPLVLQLQREDLDAIVMAVSDVNLGLPAFDDFDPDAVAGVELAVFLAASADGFQMLEVLVEPAHALAAVAVHHVNISVRRDRDIGGIRPVELLRGGTFLRHVANLVKDPSLKIRLVNALAELRAFPVRAHVLGPIEELARRFLAPVNTMRRVLHLRGTETEQTRDLIAPRFEQDPFAIKDRNGGIRGARGHINPVQPVHHDAAAEPILHSLRQLAPALNHFIGVITAADPHAGLGRLLGRGRTTRQRQTSRHRGRGGSGQLEKIAARLADRKEIFVGMHVV